jgi:hypothetical protein
MTAHKVSFTYLGCVTVVITNSEYQNRNCSGSKARIVQTQQQKHKAKTTKVRRAGTSKKPGFRT